MDCQRNICPFLETLPVDSEFMTQTTTLCEIKVGFFLLRPCGRTAEQKCNRCGKCACRDHLALLQMAGRTEMPNQQVESSRICVDCRRLDQNSTRDNNDSSSQSSSSSTSSSAEAVWKGAGGAFAGAGAAGAWAVANANPPLPLESTTAEQQFDSTISAQNLAMFDQVAHADERGSKNGAFDS